MIGMGDWHKIIHIGPLVPEAAPKEPRQPGHCSEIVLMRADHGGKRSGTKKKKCKRNALTRIFDAGTKCFWMTWFGIDMWVRLPILAPSEWSMVNVSPPQGNPILGTGIQKKCIIYIAVCEQQLLYGFWHLAPAP